MSEQSKTETALYGSASPACSAVDPHESLRGDSLEAAPPLLPCPFCGGVPKWERENYFREKEDAGNWNVRCSNGLCLTSSPGSGETMEKAANVWNRRVNVSQNKKNK